jgi:hypothetical protein
VAEKVSRVFLASYFLLQKRLSMKPWMRRLQERRGPPCSVPRTDDCPSFWYTGLRSLRR